MKKIKMFVISIVLLVFIAEVLIRLTFEQKLVIRHYPDIYKNIEKIGYVYKPNYEGTFKTPLNTFSFKLNNEGWRDSDFSKKEENTFRVILLGTSDEHGYAGLLKQKMKRSKMNVEVLNCSIDGGFRDTQRLQLIDRLLKYNPDAIFFSSPYPLSSCEVYRSYYKGFSIRYSEFKRLDEIKKYIDSVHLSFSISRFLFEKSYLFRYICKYYSENDNVVTEVMNYLPLLTNKRKITEQVRRKILIEEYDKQFFLSDQDSKNKLIETYRYLEGKNIKFVCSNLLLNKKMKNACDSIGISYVSTNVEYDKRYTDGDLDGHLTKKFNIKFVKEYYDNLLTTDIIPKEYQPKSRKKGKKIKRSK